MFCVTEKNPRMEKSSPHPQAIIVGVDSVTMAIAQKLLCADWNVIYYDRSMNLLQVRFVVSKMHRALFKHAGETLHFSLIYHHFFT